MRPIRVVVPFAGLIVLLATATAKAEVVAAGGASSIPMGLLIAISTIVIIVISAFLEATRLEKKLREIKDSLATAKGACDDVIAKVDKLEKETLPHVKENAKKLQERVDKCVTKMLNIDVFAGKLDALVKGYLKQLGSLDAQAKRLQEQVQWYVTKVLDIDVVLKSQSLSPEERSEKLKKGLDDMKKFLENGGES